MSADHKLDAAKTPQKQPATSQSHDETSPVNETPVYSTALTPQNLLHLQRLIGNQAVMRMLAASVIQRKENKTGMPDALKSGVEALSGYSLDDVRVHYNSDKPAQLDALAYAQGTDIHVAPGQESHLAHEAWHVVQQSQGRVRPTMQMDGVGVNADKSLESEADTMGAKALSTPAKDTPPTAPAAASADVAQRDMGPRAQNYIDEALLALGVGYTYAQREGRLTTAEKSELEGMWTPVAKKKAPPQKKAGEEIANRLVQMLGTIRVQNVVYTNNFDTKHVYDGVVDSARAVAMGNARNPQPPWNTVFSKAYIEAHIFVLAAGQADGAHDLARLASADGIGNIALAEYYIAGVRYKPAALGIYQYRLNYAILTDMTTRTKTITLSHMQTA